MLAVKLEKEWDAAALGQPGAERAGVPLTSCRHLFCLLVSLSLHLGQFPAVIWPKIWYCSSAEWSRGQAGGCYPPESSSPPYYQVCGSLHVASVGTGCAQGGQAPGLSCNFEALLSILQSLRCGLPPSLLADVGLWASRLISGFVIICPLGGYTAIRHQVYGMYVWFLLL